MKLNRNIYIGTSLFLVLTALFIAQGLLGKTPIAEGGTAVMAPRFEVDPFWPKPLPNHWYIGMSIGVAADAQDHIWIVHRPDTVSANEAALDQKTGECCSKAPPILEFDQAGSLIELENRRSLRATFAGLLVKCGFVCRDRIGSMNEDRKSVV